MSEARVDAARAIVGRLFRAALAAVDPERAVASAITFEGDSIIAGGAVLPAPAGVHIVGVGKAAVAMTRGALGALGEVVVSGDVITKEGHVDGALPERIGVYEAGHPIPDQRGVEGTSKILERLGRLPSDVVVLALVSGGGSALLEAPRAPLTLADFATTTDQLLRAGAPIEDLNAVRAPLSRVKAGGLRAAAPNSPWMTLILSDVLGNDPRVIASGPTVPGGRNRIAALAIVDRYGLRSTLPPAVIASLEDAALTEEPGTPASDTLLIIGDNARALQAAVAEVEALGLSSRVVWTAAEGEAADLGRAFVEVVAQAPASCDVLLGGGEATVTVRGNGMGGRNTEFALAAGLELERLELDDWVVASLATDGQDALTGLAGAVADMGSARRARESGVDPAAALQRNDSRAVFDAAGGAVDSGPTGTNVNDLYLAVRVPRSRDAEAGEGD